MLKLARIGVVVVLAVAGIVPANRLFAQGQAGALARATQARPMPGDRIFLHILREPLLSDTVTVDERGEAAFPKIGVLPVGGMSVSALSDTLRARYAMYLRTPELEIVVLRRVIVNGEVAKPNVYLVPVSSTVADLIATAGGFTEASKRNRIHVVRNGTRERVKRWDKGGATAMEMLSGDELIVSRRSWVSLNILPAVSTVALLASIIITARR